MSDVAVLSSNTEWGRSTVPEGLESMMLTQLRSLPPRTYLRAVPYGLIAFLMIGIPSVLIGNPIFGRPIEPKPIDYAILAVTAALAGLIFAIRPEPMEGVRPVEEDTTPIWGGFVSFLAVGCPVCNQVVVAAIGTSGALSWWAPVQPLVGLAAIGLLVWALRKRLATHELTSCPLPDRVSAS